MANQIRYFVGLTLLLAAISAFAQITHTIEVSEPFPYVLPRTIVSALKAEAHCPGNLAGIPFDLVNRHQIILTVSVNSSGPYNFLLDTGTQVTMIDPALAAELQMSTQGAAVVAGAGSYISASFAKAVLLEVGSHSVANQSILVYDLHNLQSEGFNIRGILGEDFLQHFDVLIDNAHRLLCLNDSAVLRANVKGRHIPLVTPAEPNDGVGLPGLLIIAVRLSNGMRPVRLMRDSGANAPILYNNLSIYGAAAIPRRAFTWERRGWCATNLFCFATAGSDNRLNRIDLRALL